MFLRGATVALCYALATSPAPAAGWTINDLGSIDTEAGCVDLAWEVFARYEYGDDDGWTLIAKAAQAIKRQRPDFSTRAFGCVKFVDVVRRLSDHFDLKRVKRGAGEAYVYRGKSDD